MFVRTKVKVMIPWSNDLSVNTLEIHWKYLWASSPTRDTLGASIFITGT